MVQLDVVEAKKRIREVARQRGYNIQNFCEEMGITSSQMYSKRVFFSVNMLMIIAEKLNTTIDYIVFGK